MAIPNGLYPFSGRAGGFNNDISIQEYSLAGMTGNVEAYPQDSGHRLVLFTGLGTGVTGLDVCLDCVFCFLEFTLPENHSFSSLRVGNRAEFFPFSGLDSVSWTAGHTYQVQILNGKCLIHEWGEGVPVEQPPSWLLEEGEGSWLWEDFTAMRQEETT